MSSWPYIAMPQKYSSAVNEDFQIKVKTDNVGTSADNQIMLPIQGPSMVIDWGDGSALETVTQANTPNNTLVGGDNVVHTYSVAGTYEIKISNAITRVYFNNGGDKAKLTDISNWGTAVWDNFISAFFGCANAVLTATDVPDLSGLTYLGFQALWRDCTSLVGGVGGWDTTGITFMYACFQDSGIKEDLSSWNFESVAGNQLANFLSGVDINATGTTTNYDALLNSIASQSVNNSVTFHGGNSEYSSAGETARWQLVAVHDSSLADASGTDKSIHDAEVAGFQFWHTVELKVYIKKSAVSADWTTALNLGKSWTIIDGGLV